MTHTNTDQPRSMPTSKLRSRGRGRGTPIVGAKPRLFQVKRNKDLKGNSGTGRVIEGVLLTSGKVVIEWQTPNPSIAVFNSLNDFLAVHVKPQYEHENEFTWIDGYKPAEDVSQVCDTIEMYVMAFKDLPNKHKGDVISVLRGIKKKYQEVI